MATFRNGKRTTYTYQQIVKAYTGRTYKTTSAIERQYKRIYNRAYAKLRKYEELSGAKPQNVKKFLLNKVRWKARLKAEGIAYKSRATRRFIEKLDLRRNVTKQTQNYIKNRFDNLLKKDSRAQIIYNETKDDPKRLLRAMTKYANLRKEKYRDLKDTVEGKQTIKEKGGIYSEEISGEALIEAVGYERD